MPKTKVKFYKENEQDESSVLEKWLDKLPTKIKAKCIARIELLEEMGHELRRPVADILRDKIYELRIKSGHVNYRMLYFFVEKCIAVISHGLTKKKEVPSKEIDLTIDRREQYLKDPKKHGG